MRIAVFIIAALQIGMFLVTTLSLGGSDPAGNAMSQGFATLRGIVLAVFLVPALILAISRKGLVVALILALVPLVLVVPGLAPF